MKRSRSWDDCSIHVRVSPLKLPGRKQFGREKCNLEQGDTSALVSSSVDQTERECSLRKSCNDDCDVKNVVVSIDSLGGKRKDDEFFCEEHVDTADGKDKQGKGADKGEQYLKALPELKSFFLYKSSSQTDQELELEGTLRSGGESSSEQKHQLIEENNHVSALLEVKGAVGASVSHAPNKEEFHENNASNLVNESIKFEEERGMKLILASNVEMSENAVGDKANENSRSQGHDFQRSLKEMPPERGEKVVHLWASPLMEEKESDEHKERPSELGLDAEKRKSSDLGEEPREAEGRNLETEQVPVILFGPCKDNEMRINASGESIDHMTRNLSKGKAKNSEISLSHEADSMDEDDEKDGPSIISNFELVFRSNISKSDKYQVAKDRPESGPLDLALGLQCGSSCDPGTKATSLNSKSTQSLLASFGSDSAALTASVSFSGLETLVHAASCSLTHNSVQDYEHSIGSSRHKFGGITQDFRNIIWQGEPSNESKSKGATILKRQRSVANGKSDRAGKTLKRDRSNGSIFKDRQEGAEHSCSNGFSGTEKVLNKIVCEPLSIACRMIQEMSHQSVTYLRESIGQMVINGNKRGPLAALQDALKERSDLTLNSLSKCHRVVLEILVTLKTSLPDFLLKADNVPSSDLAEIFLNFKCQNIACRSALPVDECDCKMCAQQNGFCSACMCLVCSAFDSASNTCGWVGCDVCLHWCHTDCALKASHIRNGLSVSEIQKNPEMQFHCPACGHPSEMFGFVKEVFKACSKDWTTDTLVNELGYVSKIFHFSEDSRGKQLYNVANHLLMKLENRALQSEVVDHMLSFLTGKFIMSPCMK